MKFLEICQKAHGLSGLSGNAPTSVTGQGGMNAKLVNAVADGWDEIQNQPNGKWRFARASITPTALTVGVQDYTLSSAPFTLSDFEEWVLESLVLYTSGSTDKARLTYRDYAGWLNRYATATFQAGRPNEFTMLAAEKMRLNALPDIAYLAAGDYYRTAQRLADNDDVPRCPGKHHMLLVWKGLERFWRDRGSVAGEAEAALKVSAFMFELSRTERERPTRTPHQPPVGLTD